MLMRDLLLVIVVMGWTISQASSAAVGEMVGTAADWPNHAGDADETGFSRLDQIKTSNVAKLGLEWSLELPGEVTLEATPLAVNGVLYFTGSYAAVYAVDAVTGKLLWKFDPQTWAHNPDKMHFSFGANRGVAYANGRIFSAALDGRLFAFDAKTGGLLWSVETTSPQSVQSITGAPRTFKDKVIMQAPKNVFFYVIDRQTGKLVSAEKIGKVTWADRIDIATGRPVEAKNIRYEAGRISIWPSSLGAHSWQQMSYSPGTGLVYI